MGDPGAGKTRLFEEAANEEGGHFLDIRRFLRVSLDGPIQQPLYLDALDEVRARTDDGHAVLDQVISRLVSLGRPKLRLSCRAADWFGGLDESHLADVSTDGKVRVLRLCPLSELDAHAIVEAHGHDADEFLRQAREQGFLDWLKNPQDIELLLRALTDGSWPQTRRELFRRACGSLALEPNKSHSRMPRAKVSTDRLLDAAGLISTCYLIAGPTGFSRHQQGELEFPWIGDLLYPEVDQSTIEEVARRRLFREDSSGHVVPMHRSIAEYLAADFLAHRCRQRLLLSRVLGLITAPDGGVPSELRGLYAWLTCIATEHVELLLPKDPLAVVLYGDVGLLGISARKQLLAELRAEAERDPYFRADAWHQRPFAAFATPQLETELRQLLEDDEAPWRMTVAVLDAVASGEPLPDLGDLLLSLIRDTTRVRAVAIRAVQAFCRICPERTEDMRALLEEIQRGGIEDTRDRMRATLCEYLFPEGLSAAEVVHFIPQPKANETSSFSYFLGSRFVDQLPSGQLVDALDAFAGWQPDPEQGDRSWLRLRNRHLRRCLASVLARGLADLGQSVEVSRLYGWLGIHVARESRYERSVLWEEDAAPIRRWLAAHTQTHRELYRHVLAQSSADEMRHDKMNLFNRCCRQEPPELGRLFLDLAAETADDELAQQFFVEAVGMSHQTDSPPYFLEEIWQTAREQPRFSETLENLRVCPLDVRHQWAVENLRWEAEHLRREAEDRKKEEEAKQQSRRWLLENLESLASGKEVHALNLLSDSYYNFTDEEDLRSLPRERRLAKLWGEKVNVAALQGFVQVALKSETYDVAMLGELSTKNSSFKWVRPVHAGIELMWKRRPGAGWNLPARNLAVAVVCHLNGISTTQERPADWLDFALKNHPQACAAALTEFWSPAFKSKKDDARGLDRLKDWPTIRRLVAGRLLASFPRAHPNLARELVAASLAEGCRSEILEHARRLLDRPQGLHTEQFLLWLAVAFLLAPDAYGAKLHAHASRPLRKGISERRAEFLNDAINEFSEVDESLLSSLPSEALSKLIIALTKACPYLPMLGSDDGAGKVGVPESVGSLINRLGGRVDDEARESLVHLRNHPVMAPWRDHIRHTLLSQERERREQEFRRPTMSQVLEVLKAGPPATVSDLFSLVGDYLEQVADDIRNGGSDGYKLFWDQVSQHTVGDPLPEEICRDRLKERLRIELKHFGLAVERESDVAEHKRSDLRVLSGNHALPIECKRHGHPDLWTAIENQLILKYTREPASEGFGIYCVFWFGRNEMRVPSLPEGIDIPETAAELTAALRKTIPTGYEHRIKVACIDVSRPSR